MKIIIGGHAINTKKIVAISKVHRTSNSANDIYQAFGIMFINKITIEINQFSGLNPEDRFLSKEDLEKMRDELIAIWNKSYSKLHHIKP